MKSKLKLNRDTVRKIDTGSRQMATHSFSFCANWEGACQKGEDDGYVEG